MTKLDLMIDSINDNDVEKIKSMLNNGFNPNIYHSKPLNHAISLCTNYIHGYYQYPNNKAIVNSLLDIGIILVKHGADINRLCNRKQNTLLSLCAHVKRNDDILYFVRNNYKIEWETNLFWTLDEAANLHNNEALVNELIDYGHTITDYSKSSILLMMAQYGQLEACKKLLNYGSAIDMQDEDGCSPLMYAAEQHHDDVVLFLLENKANYHLKDRYGYKAFDKCDLDGECEKIIKSFMENEQLISNIDDANHSSEFNF